MATKGSATATHARAGQPGRGRRAETPSHIPAAGWKDILYRLYEEFTNDRVTLIAAGATFYLLLALFPALAAFVSIYGFVADPVTIADHIAFLGGILPAEGVDLIKQQLQSLAAQDTSSLSFGFIFGLLIALWSANNGIKTLFEAMNIAYDETEKRSFIRLNLVSLAFTLGAIMIGIFFIVSVGIVPVILETAGLSSFAERIIALGRWPVLLAAITVAIGLIYRYGPSRETAKLRWITWGSAITAVVWIAASVLFSWYLQNFANYNATYGSLGAIIGLMMWMWVSVVILILGAELNSEMEHQTAEDTTVGAAKPLGSRGATMADTVGKSHHEGPEPENTSPLKERGPGQEEERPAGQDGRARSPAREARPSMAVALPVAAAIAWWQKRRRGS